MKRIKSLLLLFFRKEGLPFLTSSVSSFVVCLACVTANASTVLVTVTGVRNTHGHVRVAICSRADFLQPHCPFTGKAPAAIGDVLITIPNVPPGTYAAQAYHDENDNGRIDRSWLGQPEEAIGFSNNARMFFGPPQFATAAFVVAAADVKITFALRYF